ncbi:kinase-like domain-containing protein [Gigaspora rosea]|uniref:Kinase-like domain-containing protein n=1 Tax=Gigaspora rosea TaxID=44941 RepID=A0A397VW76_9GLOM|nr:kinase-like domain-containing protein [Gigaspora rosea]
MDEDYYLLVECADQGKLECYLENKNNVLNWDQKMDFAIQLVRGLDFLHIRDRVHLDLNPNNIFIHENVLKITNFGVITIFRPTGDSERVPYIDPQELQINDEQVNDYQNHIRRSIVTKKSNIYSFGVLLWQISSGKKPYVGIPHSRKIAEIISGTREEAAPETPTDYFKLYQKCERPDCSRALRMLKTANTNDVIGKETLDNRDQESVRKDLDSVFKKYGEFIAQSVEIGGALIIKLTSYESFSQNIENIKAHVYWAYDQIITGKPNVFDQVRFNNFTMKDANNQTIIISGHELKNWMKKFYDHKDGYVISYNRIIRVYSLFNYEINQNLRNNLENFNENPVNTEFIPDMNNFDNKDLNTWISCSPPIHLCDWVNNLRLRYGLTVQPCKIGRGQEVAIDFIKIPDIRSYNNSYMRLRQPSSKKEAFILTNNIKFNDNDIEIPFLPEKLDDNFHPIFDCQPTSEVHCFIASEKNRIDH